MLPGSKIAQTKDCQGHLQPESAGFGKRTESDYTQLQSGRRLKLRMKLAAISKHRTIAEAGQEASRQWMEANKE